VSRSSSSNLRGTDPPPPAGTKGSSEKPDHRALLSEALLAMERMQEKLDTAHREKNEPVAVVGIGCRFPGGADDPDAFWELLRRGTDTVREVPPDRWDIDAFYDGDPETPGTMYTREGGFLDEVGGFDAQFFGISPREVRSMDPQQRLVLEVAWEAFERAGLPRGKLKGSLTGVYVGIGGSDFAQLQAQSGDIDSVDPYTGSGSGLCFVAGRISYCLGLEGPSLIVDTACSSSLVAIHLACQGLRAKECDTAVAGGVNLMLSPLTSVYLSRTRALAPDGRCKAFDAAADGFARGEGCGMVVLKRLSDARKAGDRVLAVIMGSAVNQDGMSSGITVPNGRAQQAVIRQALARAGIQPKDVTYVEAHGTGTSLGDPIEMGALVEAFGEGRESGQALVVGSVKSNLGHLEAAAGIAGLIKAILAVHHGAIPPHLHFKEWNPGISLGEFPVQIPTETVDWPGGDVPRIAGVSSFGLSGTNAHVVVGESPKGEGERDDTPRLDERDRPAIFTLSAKGEGPLRELRDRCVKWLEANPEASLPDVCWMANAGRSHFEHRLAVVARTTDGLREALALPPAGQALVREGHLQDFVSLPVAFLFTGQGSQYLGMGQSLFEAESVFRAALERCDQLLRSELDTPLLELIHGEPRQEGRLDQTAFTQPALFAIEYALAQLWRSWGIQPSVMLGHSVGEYVAACVAGVFELEDALRLVATRGRLMQSLPSGGVMAAVQADETRVKSMLPGGASISIAAVNSPDSTVVSGEANAVQELLDALANEGIDSQKLNVSHAFHSCLMDPILQEFEEQVNSINLRPPQIGIVSNLTGRLVEGKEMATPSYWSRHIRATVRFKESIETLWEQGYRVFLELGPHPTLTTLGRRCVPETEGSWPCSLRRHRDGREMILDAVADLYVAGVPVDWDALLHDLRGRQVSLPTYPFQRVPFPLKPETAERAGGDRSWGRPAGRQHPLLGARIDLAAEPRRRVWLGEFDVARLPYLSDHRVQGAVVVPATAYLEMAFAAAREVAGEGALSITDSVNEQPLVLFEGSSCLVQFTLEAASEDRWSFLVHSRAPDDENWTLHARGTVAKLEHAPIPFEHPEVTRQRCPDEVKGTDFYRLLGEKGNVWGPSFQGVETLWRGEGEAVSAVRVPGGVETDLAGYLFHPALADACGHVLVGTAPLQASDDPRGGALVGGGIDEVRLFAPPQGLTFTAVARVRQDEGIAPNELVGDVMIYDSNGLPVSETLGARLWYLTEDESFHHGPNPELLYQVDWEEAAPGTAPTDATGHWLILADKGGLAETLASAMSRAGVICTLAHTGGKLREKGDRRFEVSPEASEQIRGLLDTAAANDGALTGVVHLWSIDSPPCDALSPHDLAQEQRLGGESTLLLVQQLAALPGSKPRLWIATKGTQAVDGTGVDNVVQAPLWGLTRGIAAEYGELWGGIIDLDPRGSPADQTDMMVKALLSADEDDRSALRDGRRFVPRLRPMEVASGRDAAAFTCTPDGVYLITGGLGGIGLQIASWLVERGARHLVLMGRTTPPERNAWKQVGPDDRWRPVIEAIRGLEADGAEVCISSTDVSVPGELEPALARATADRPIRGVVHAAGVMQYEPIGRQTVESMRAVFAAKALGCWTLHKLLADNPLDFFVMCSSTAALLNSPLIAGYSAANAFLDSVAGYRGRVGQSALSVNWGTWGDVGMITRFGSPDETTMIRSLGVLGSEEAVVALQWCLASEVQQAAVMRVDWQAWARQYPDYVSSPYLSETRNGPFSPKRTGGSSDAAQAILGAPPHVMAERVREYLREEVVRILERSVEELDTSVRLTQLGFDSLMAIELKNRIEKDIHVVIPAVEFLGGPSVDQLVERVTTLVERLSTTPPARGGSATGAEDEFLNGERAEALLGQLDDMSDEQVKHLLAQLAGKDSAE
jgi:acyl transferase domain-containing protein/acyl carrier protein